MMMMGQVWVSETRTSAALVNSCDITYLSIRAGGGELDALIHECGEDEVEAVRSDEANGRPACCGSLS